MKHLTLATCSLLLAVPLVLAERPIIGSVVRHDPVLDKLLAKDAKIEMLTSGFVWSEGPVWDKENSRLLWSDVPANAIYQWSEKNEGHSVFMSPSGYTGITGGYPEPGSNGLAFDAMGRLVSCEHGDRRVAMLTPGGGKVTLASHYHGKRLNSPNDLAIHSSGAIYFTDPPYGLPKREKDSKRELDWFGVYRIETDGAVTLMSKECDRPNGIALSPDEKTLYVAQSHGPQPHIFAWDLKDDGSLGPRRTLFDCSVLSKKYPGAPDGMKVDKDGIIWTTGPGGVLIISPEGKLLGHILTGQHTANCNWGDDGSTLYMTADFYICRIKTLTKGAGW
ncbi:MAG: SMP-30/gluconolactonase/LRE family protein [Roseibacillus sp.]|jgi:gluconolactonase|nr:SMP-30/gluconolactonase/LRE family protein [Roseibacillus sp.]